MNDALAALLRAFVIGVRIGQGLIAAFGLLFVVALFAGNANVLGVLAVGMIVLVLLGVAFMAELVVVRPIHRVTRGGSGE